ncbi:uncharacterized protein LOC105217561 [Zeugodacus cucurbitae]|uniref:uncharacterized protein LOC105217561 n=1 Tax=Zeugodacus cucurbitae TaxID=28588 RepID=UPI0023D94033|nr:uncharacterized protein LOC105217561 [Zeugodacus cucurbitae]
MLRSCCCRFTKTRSSMVMLKTIRMFTDFYDKGKAEENIFFLKEQREKLRELRKKMREMEGTLEKSIKALEEVDENMKSKKKEPKKKNK